MERLRLRPWRFDDVDDVLAYADDPEWSRFLRLLPRPYTRDDAIRFVARQLIQDRIARPAWAVTLHRGGDEAWFAILRPEWER